MIPDEDKTVGERIAVARDEYKLSQVQLAAHVGVTRAAISQYELDKTRPRRKIIDRLAELFNAAPEWFERGRGKAPDPLEWPVVIPEIDVLRLTPGIADPRDLSLGPQWKVPVGMFPGVVVAAETLVAFRAPNDAGPVQCGDRVVIDIERRGPADGVFLTVGATGARLCRYKTLIDDPEPQIVGQAIAYFRAL